MSLRFAPSRQGNDALLARMLTPAQLKRPANDNGRAIGDLLADPDTMRATLLHFARHGLAAAEVARSEAEAALASGDEDGWRHWLAVVRQLDRRLARRLEGKVPSARI